MKTTEDLAQFLRQTSYYPVTNHNVNKLQEFLDTVKKKSIIEGSGDKVSVCILPGLAFLFVSRTRFLVR